MSPNTKDALIKLNRIEFTYTGATPTGHNPSNTHSSKNSRVLNLPSWQVAAGEHVLLIGASGSGKSTLLNVLSGILVPDLGKVVVAGHALETMNNRQRDRFRATEIGYVAQSFNLIPYLSAIDNIKLANYFCDHSSQENNTVEVEALLQELNITENEWHRPAKQLSVGQQQRVAIARAIVNKPKLLIADEPTSSLDQSNRDNFMSMLMTTASDHNMTLVFVSHDLSLSSYFDRVDSMSDINRWSA